jgi:hypothetical protein
MDELTAKEIGKKYSHTYALVLARGWKTPMPAYLDNFHQNEDDNLFYFDVYTVTKLRTKQEMLLGSNINTVSGRIELHQLTIYPMPDRQVFDYGGCSYVYSRFPNRQYQKGLCNSNTIMKSPVHTIVDETLPQRTSSYKVEGRKSIKVGFAEIFNLLSTNYANTFNEAVKDITEFSLMSRCINSEYFVSLFPDKYKQYILFRLDVPIAFYNKDSDTFKLISSLYYQEISDFCRRQYINSKIEV